MLIKNLLILNLTSQLILGIMVNGRFQCMGSAEYLRVSLLT